ELLRVRPDRVDRRAHRQRLAVAVEDRAAMSRDGRHPREARRALLREEGVIDELQLDGPPEEPERTAAQEAQQQVRPPAEVAAVRGRVARGAAAHGEITSISCGGGIAIFRRVLATRSTKAWVDQAL